MIIVNDITGAAIWACPSCLGDTSGFPYQHDGARCIGCGRTIQEFLNSVPRRHNATITYLRFPDCWYPRQEFIDFDQAFPGCSDPS